MIYFAKVNEDAKIPTKREEDGCYDLYASFSGQEEIILPHKTKLIRTGIKSAFPNTRRVAFRERGTNTKTGLIVMAGQIDSGFRGIWFVALHNTNSFPVVISKEEENDLVMKTDPRWGFEYLVVPYSKAIAQFAIEEVPEDEIEIVSELQIDSLPSLRGTGELGSSNK